MQPVPATCPICPVYVRAVRLHTRKMPGAPDWRLCRARPPGCGKTAGFVTVGLGQWHGAVRICAALGSPDVCAPWTPSDSFSLFERHWHQPGARQPRWLVRWHSMLHECANDECTIPSPTTEPKPIHRRRARAHWRQRLVCGSRGLCGLQAWATLRMKFTGGTVRPCPVFSS